MHPSHTLLIVGFLFIAAARPSFAETVELRGLKQDMEGVVAAKLAQFLKAQGQAAVTIGPVTGRDVKTNIGPGVREMLKDALSQLLPVVEAAPFTISGVYQIARDREAPDQSLVLLTLDVVDDFGEKLVAVDFRIRNNTDLALASGLTGTIPKDGFKDERNRKVNEQIRDPKVFIQGSQIKTSATSKYAVEILAKPVSNNSPAKPCSAHAENGQAFVPLATDDVYEIVIHNHDTREIAVGVTIDGLSAFEFSDVRTTAGKPAYSHYIIPAGQTTRVVGWHKNDSGHDNFLSFLVTEYGKGASAKAAQPSQGSVGVISVAISYSHPPGAKSAGQETGFGPPRSVTVTKVERNIEPPHEFISVRYTK